MTKLYEDRPGFQWPYEGPVAEEEPERGREPEPEPEPILELEDESLTHELEFPAPEPDEVAGQEASPKPEAEG